jgi:lysophospholipase L1-like esterase
MESNQIKRPGQWRIALTAVLLILAATAGLAELLSRVAANPCHPPPPPSGRVQDPTAPNPHIFYCRPFLYSHKPGTQYTQQRLDYSVEYRINSRGFRGPELPAPTEGKRRLLVIGDSMVEGQGCPFERTMPLVLNGLLEDHGWEAVNAGVQGAGPAYYALNIDRYLALQPDAVMVVLYENDLLEDRVHEQKYDSLPLLDYPDELLTGEVGAGWRGSAALAVLRRGLRYAVPGRDGRIITTCRKQARAAGLEPGATPNEMLPRIRDHWSISTRYLDHLALRFGERGVKVFVTTLIVPIHTGQRNHLQRRLETLAREWASGAGIDYFRIRPHFGSALTRQGYYELVIRDDGHLTPAGHALAAHAMADWLIDRGRLPGSGPGDAD